MLAIFRKAQTVRGVVAPRRRFTLWAALYFAAFVAVPVLAIGLGLDAMVYAAMDRPFGTCLSTLCWAR